MLLFFGWLSQESLVCLKILLMSGEALLFVKYPDGAV